MSPHFTQSFVICNKIAILDVALSASSSLLGAIAQPSAMKSVLDMILQQPNTQADFKSLKDRLSRKVDVILAAGVKLDSSGESSQLQNCIAELLKGSPRVFAGCLRHEMRLFSS